MYNYEKPQVKKVCCGCNKEFTLKMAECPALNKSLINIATCPHCNARNDVWIEVEWKLEPLEKGDDN